jgi:hypothetical protein
VPTFQANLTSESVFFSKFRFVNSVIETSNVIYLTNTSDVLHGGNVRPESGEAAVTLTTRPDEME